MFRSKRHPKELIAVCFNNIGVSCLRMVIASKHVGANYVQNCAFVIDKGV